MNNLILSFILILNVNALVFQTQPPNNLITIFLTHYLEMFNLSNPKIFVSNINLGKQLYHQMSDKSYQSLIRKGFNADILNTVSSERMLNNIVIVGNNQVIQSAIQLAFRLKFLLRPGAFLLVCLECNGNFTIMQGYDIHTKIVIASFKAFSKIFTVELQSLTYNHNVRHLLLNHFGFWSEETGFDIVAFPQTNNFQNSTLNILCMEIPYFLPLNKKNHSVSGFVWDIALLLSRSLNFNINLTISMTTVYEAQTANGTWIGIIQDFVDNNYDILIGAFSATTRRRQIVDFTSSILEDRLVIAVHHQSTLNKNSWLFTKQIIRARSVWFATLVILLSIGICLKLILICNHTFSHITWFVLLVSISLNQGRTQPLNGGKCSLMILICVGSSFFWMATSYYGLFLESLLAVGNNHLMKNVADVLSSSYRIGANSGGSTIYQLTTSANTEVKTLVKNLVIKDPEVGFDSVCQNENYGHVVGLYKGSLGLKARKSCPAYFVKEVLFEHPYHFITRNGKILDDRISLILLKLKEYGILNRLMIAHGIDGTIKNSILEEDINENETLHIFQISDLFIYYFISIGLSLLVLFLEIFYSNWTHAF